MVALRQAMGAAFLFARTSEELKLLLLENSLESNDFDF